jgi:hypothetical protein
VISCFISQIGQHECRQIELRCEPADPHTLYLHSSLCTVAITLARARLAVHRWGHTNVHERYMD